MQRLGQYRAIAQHVHLPEGEIGSKEGAAYIKKRSPGIALAVIFPALVDGFRGSSL
ncbi:MAG: hypothetical protein HC925_06020 [Coleofasciculaceae cyanobacterium SM2_3_26]|nr:hypothetical protein [Coleofasciculaceae cyanobacterium SM2_3_26]